MLTGCIMTGRHSVQTDSKVTLHKVAAIRCCDCLYDNCIMTEHLLVVAGYATSGVTGEDATLMLTDFT